MNKPLFVINLASCNFVFHFVLQSTSMGENTELLAHPNAFVAPCRWNLIQFGFICVYTMGLNAIWSFPSLVYRLSGKHRYFWFILYHLLQRMPRPLIIDTTNSRSDSAVTENATPSYN